MKTQTEITNALRGYVAVKGGQNAAAHTMNGVSAATISQILNGNTEKVSVKMWQKIESYVCTGILGDWQKADTKVYRQLTAMFRAAQEECMVMCVTGEAGSGKTFTSKIYEMENKNVLRVSCNDWWTRKDFIEEILRVTGTASKAAGGRMSDKLVYAIAGLKMKRNAVLILDEFDKLRDDCLYLFISMYNEVEDQIGIVTLSTNYIEQRLQKGLRRNKKGYKEVWSRLGDKCVSLANISEADVRSVCEANEVNDASIVDEICSESQGDLRRVKRKVFVAKRPKAAKGE